MSQGFPKVKIVDSDGVEIDVASESTLKSIAGFNIPEFDEIIATYPNATTEVYTYKKSSVTVGTITVVFTTSSKDTLSSVTKT
jgi:hypothetical protein